MLIDNPEEVLDLVNDHDEVVGTIQRAEVPQLSSSNKGFVRAVGVFLQNPNKQLFVPTRSLHKKLLPGAYDFSAAGHVASGKTYIESALQETSEELNIQLSAASFKLIGTLKPFNNVPYFNHIFVVPYNDTPNYNKDDFYKAEWLYVDELIKNIQAGHPTKQIILPALKLL